MSETTPGYQAARGCLQQPDAEKSEVTIRRLRDGVECPDVIDLRTQLADATAELDRYREEVRNPLASERDHYRHLAERRYHLHDELFAALPTVDRDADGDTQIRQAVAEIAGLKARLATEQQAHRETREALGRAVEIIRAALLTEHTPSENACGETNYPPYRWTCCCGARAQQVEQLTHAADCILSFPLAVASTKARQSKNYQLCRYWFAKSCGEQSEIDCAVCPKAQALDALRKEDN